MTHHRKPYKPTRRRHLRRSALDLDHHVGHHRTVRTTHHTKRPAAVGSALRTARDRRVPLAGTMIDAPRYNRPVAGPLGTCLAGESALRDRESATEHRTKL